ncbi:conserved hypothetical protein [Nitrosopumilaceae archaeon]|nr:nickel pincer cofactor biosynthesis protein LarC [Nitrosopumilus sp.]CAI9832744.1 conserved hypothetical protein [Nitrosopumilaceae archaeon]MDA7941834.1 nickel pincer cofactor biosynthesis protein LarC [Nitrosopumilus sp.]MDA7945397.1 nickel pincer cofactor biosynthesis protein LarC [Nitrosopumilus sp.]MDA7955077.1 nickel pincer cofactor biosynthesis protein LarC [Nitrosopumilus sp.]
MVLVVDPQVAGVSGDMFLCSLLDMGADPGRVRSRILECADLAGQRITRLEFARVRRGGVSAFGMELEAEGPTSRTGASMRGAIGEAAGRLGLSGDARAFAASCIGALVGSESRVHGVPEDSVHLHEAAGADTLADIIGAASAMDDLGLFGERVVCMPVAVGAGTVEFSHGVMSNPGGAVLEILRGTGAVIRGGPGGSELATPTGASIIASLGAEHAASYPAMRVEAVGYGAGRAEAAFPNVLKVVRGAEEAAPPAGRVSVLETSVDDVTGEALGGLPDRLVDGGALDAAVLPGTGKRGRPSWLIRVVCRPGDAAGLAGRLIRETGTLGVRVSVSERIEAAREERRATVRISGRSFDVSYKVSEFGGVRGYKIQFDDSRRVAAETGMAVRDAEAAIRRCIDGQA